MSLLCHFLVGHPLVARFEVDDAAIGEAVFEKIMLHDLIVTMGVNSNIAIYRKPKI